MEISYSVSFIVVAAYSFAISLFFFLTTFVAFLVEEAIFFPGNDVEGDPKLYTVVATCLEVENRTRFVVLLCIELFVVVRPDSSGTCRP